jgi:four helix bundle protein
MLHRPLNPPILGDFEVVRLPPELGGKGGQIIPLISNALTGEFTMQKSIQSFQNLQVYRLAYNCSVEVYTLAQQFPEDANHYLTCQILATSRAVRAHIAAAWGQRRHREILLSKLSAAQWQAAEMQTWLEAAIVAGFVDGETGQVLYDRYRQLYTALDQLMATASSTDSTRLEHPPENSLPATA